MALKLRKRRITEPEVPVASFSDIAFLLIVFFMVATTLRTPMGLRTDLPSGDKQENKQEQKKTNIVNLDGGKIIFNDKPTDLPTLQTALKLLQLGQKAEGQERVVLLEATGAVPYQLYYDVMLSISNAGGVIGIVREQEGGS